MPAWPARARSPDMPGPSAAVAEVGAGGPRRQAAAVVPSQEGPSHWRCEGPSGL